jgi:hypothetical protein
MYVLELCVVLEDLMQPDGIARSVYDGQSYGTRIEITSIPNGGEVDVGPALAGNDGRSGWVAASRVQSICS